MSAPRSAVSAMTAIAAMAQRARSAEVFMISKGPRERQSIPGRPAVTDNDLRESKKHLAP